MRTAIISKAFILRPYRKGDENSLQQNISNKEIYKRTIEIPYPYTLKHAASWIKRCTAMQRKKRKTEINFAIDKGGMAVGGIGIKNIIGHQGEIGYWLGKRYWGKGIMTEALELVTAYGFDKLKLKRITACVFPSNRASAHVLEKADYKYEGTVKKGCSKDGRCMDKLMFSKVK